MSTGSYDSREIDEAARRRFELDWKHGPPASLDEYLPEPGDRLFLATLEELVHVDLEFAWKRSQQNPAAQESQPLVERYVKQFPQLNEPAVLLRLIRQEYIVRHRYGDRPSTNVYRERFPTIVATGSELSGEIPESGQLNFGNYAVVGEQGRGGFGLIWRAYDPKFGRHVALKQIKPVLAKHEDLRRRFVGEARIAARLEHPGVVPVYDMGGLDGTNPYYTMKLVRGKTLEQAIREFHEPGRPDGNRRVEQIRLLNIFIAVTRTLEYAHAQGVIHRDLKPQNIILGSFGETIVLDWGLAKMNAASAVEQGDAGVPIPAADAAPVVTQPGTLQGTPAYMAPEQADGRLEAIDSRTDIYALGVVLYQLLTGSLPFEGKTTSEVLDQLRYQTPRRPRTLDRSIPKPLEAICLKAMRSEPEQRYQTAAELAADVERYLADEPVSAFREGLVTRAARVARRHRTAVASTALALLFVAIGLTAATWTRQRSLLQLRTDAQADLAIAVAEMRSDRYESAAKILAQAAQRVQNTTELDPLHKELLACEHDARALAQFAKLSDEAWFLAGDERDRASIEMCCRTLKCVGADEQDEWWKVLPDASLTDRQKADLASKVHALMLLQAAMWAKSAILDLTSPEGAEFSKQALAGLARANRYKPTHFSRLVETFCHVRMGDFANIKPLTGIEPVESIDFFFFGMIYFWIGQFPDDAASRFARAMVAQVSGLDFKDPLPKSLEYFGRATELEPGNYWNHFMVAWALGAMNDYRGQELAIEACIALRPEYAISYSMRAAAIANQAFNKTPPDLALVRKADNVFQQSISLAPYDSLTYWSRSELYMRLQSVDEVVAIALQALPLEPIAPRYPGMARQMHEFCHIMSASHADHPEFRLAHAWTELKVGPAAEALKLADKAVEALPNDPRAHAIRGNVLVREGKNLAAARSDFAFALRADPKNFLALTGLAKLYEKTGEHAKSLEIYNRMLHIAVADWQKVEAFRGQSRELSQLNRKDEAQMALESARIFDPLLKD